MATSAAPLVVWDRAGEPPAGAAVLRWRDHDGDSVPAYLESNAGRLRARYLAFVRELGRARVGGARVVDRLDGGDGFSFWWTTRLAEKSPFKSPGLYDALRLLALEELLRERRPGRVELDGGDAGLAEALAVLCRNLGVAFARRGPYASRRGPRVPRPLAGLAALVRVACSIPG